MTSFVNWDHKSNKSCFYWRYICVQYCLSPFSSTSVHQSLRKAFLYLLAILWNSAFRCLHLSFKRTANFSCLKYNKVLPIWNKLTISSNFWEILPGGSVVKNSSTNAGNIRKLGSVAGNIRDWRRAWGYTLVFLPGESPWTEQPGKLQSMGSQRVGHDWNDLAFTHSWLIF